MPRYTSNEDPNNISLETPPKNLISSTLIETLKTILGESI